jgi:hypothetical protein
MRWFVSGDKDRDGVVSSVYPGSPYAVAAAKSDLGSTILCVCAMTCDIPAADCGRAGF